MRTYNRNKVLAAFTTAKRLARAGQPIVQKNLPLNCEAVRWFKEALTHNFNQKEHGFTLQPIFRIEGNKWIELENTPLNPKDDTLIDVIIKAMMYTKKVTNSSKQMDKLTFNSKSEKVSDDYLIQELKVRGYIVLKMM